MSKPRRDSAMARVFAVCGMPGSGKGEFANVLVEAGVPVVSMGDMVRAEVHRRRLEEAPHVFGEVAAELRAQHGDDVLAVRLCQTVDGLLQVNKHVLIEGLRGTAEHTIFSQRWGAEYQTVAIVADDELRFERIQQRGRSEDGDRDAFETRNKREIGWGLDRLIDSANHTLDNNHPLPAFKQECARWMTEHFQ